MLYLWVKVLHIVAVISWMAGMLYLPRLFVYHADAAPGSAQSETFKIMERRLLRGIMTPAMIVAVGAGLALFAWPGYGNGTHFSLHIKMLFVLGLVVFHMVCARWRKVFERDENRRPARFYRFWNEVPAVAMIIIVALVVVKPLG